MYLYVDPGTIKFKTLPQEITELAEEAAKHALCPPSPLLSGEEVDIFSKGGYLSLQGQVKEVHGVRMTRTQVPIVDAQLQCGQRVLAVSLWRDVALTDLYAGDEVVITHLRPCILSKGEGKYHSSAYTSVDITEGQLQEIVAEVIGVSEVSDTFHLLSTDLEVFIVPQNIVLGTPEDIINNLPLQVKLKHKNRRVIEIKSVDNSFVYSLLKKKKKD
ncbi:uncharacterized protein [Pseudorasbora parva]|uniref:uncharacterized protein n=1 Tax=Pseudorasbora parva TaxID=51549 RepID=UPI00351DBD17